MLIDKNCEFDQEIELIAFKCRVCKHQCEMGERILQAYEEAERERYHHKMETELPERKE